MKVGGDQALSTRKPIPVVILILPEAGEADGLKGTRPIAVPLRLFC